MGECGLIGERGLQLLVCCRWRWMESLSLVLSALLCERILDGVDTYLRFLRTAIWYFVGRIIVHLCDSTNLEAAIDLSQAILDLTIRTKRTINLIQ
jgi:hypothetical protein